MDAEKTTQQKIDGILEAASSIEAVGPPPFFKDKVLNRLSQEPNPKPVLDILGWLAPKYQVAAIILFVALNFTALYIYNNYNEEEELQTVAEFYQLSSPESESILN